MASNQLRTSSEPASIMEFGFKRAQWSAEAKSEARPCQQLEST